MIPLYLTLDTCDMHLTGFIFISCTVNRGKETPVRCINLTRSKLGNMLYPESSYFSPLTIKGIETISSDEAIHTLAEIFIQKKKKKGERKRGRKGERKREKAREKERNQRYRGQGSKLNGKGEKGDCERLDC